VSPEPKALISEVEGFVLERHAANVLPPAEIVEVGSWAGTSAERLCAGSKRGAGAHVTCIDTWADWVDPPEDQWPATGADALRVFLERVDPAVVMPLRAPSLVVAPMWLREIGLLFIDAGHTYEQCLADYEAWSRFVLPGGVLAIHDYLREPDPELWWCEGPTRVVEEVIEPSGRWEHEETVGWTWVGRRRS